MQEMQALERVLIITTSAVLSMLQERERRLMTTRVSNLCIFSFRNWKGPAFAFCVQQIKQLPQVMLFRWATLLICALLLTNTLKKCSSTPSIRQLHCYTIIYLLQMVSLKLVGNRDGQTKVRSPTMWSEMCDSDLVTLSFTGGQFQHVWMYKWEHSWRTWDFDGSYFSSST